MFTLVGGGISSYASSRKYMKEVLPKRAKWLKASIVGFQPDVNEVSTHHGDTIKYDIMIVALGLQLNWDRVRYYIVPKCKLISYNRPNMVLEYFYFTDSRPDGQYT